MCSEWAVTFTDPNFEPDPGSLNKLVELFRESQTESYEIYAERYPQPVFWADWSAMNHPCSTGDFHPLIRFSSFGFEAYCPACSSSITDWFKSLDMPEYRQAFISRCEAQIEFPCCKQPNRLSQIEFVGTVGFARSFIFIDEFYRENLALWELINEPQFQRWQRENGCELIVFMHNLN